MDFRAGLKKTGLAPTRSGDLDASGSPVAAATGSAAPAAAKAVAKPPDVAKSKSGDLAAKLAARRQWEGAGESGAPADSGGAAGGGDLASKLAARRKWEGGEEVEAPAPVIAPR